jgi:hypothetical protein
MRNTILISTLILVLTGIAFAQAEPKAIKFAEFGPMSQAGVKKKVEAFQLELRKDLSAQGYLINYGTVKALTARQKQLSSALIAIHDLPRITFVNGPLEKKVRTVMWIVPPGAKPPIP